MAGEAKLIHGLLERLSSRLPHRTGISLHNLRHDPLVTLTRETLIQVSASAIQEVIDCFLPLIEGLSESVAAANGSVHAIQSETFLLELLADCCTAHWNEVRRHASAKKTNGAQYPPRTNGDADPVADASKVQSHVAQPHDVVPPSLEENHVTRLLDVFTRLIAPAGETQHLSTTTILEIGPKPQTGIYRGALGVSDNAVEPSRRSHSLERAAFVIVQYLSAANWSLIFNFIQGKLRSLRALSTGSAPPRTSAKDQDAASTTIQMMAHLWVNGRKLSLVIQEICACFLNLSKASQHAVAICIPETIARWLHHNPAEFVDMHMSERRLDGVVEVLFEMSYSMIDDSPRKSISWPFQSSLVLLLPEVFWVAGNMRDAKSGSVAKKAAFLEGLRKSLHSPRTSSTAVYCLTGLCRVAHYLPSDHESALLSYALDVQNEIRETVFEPGTTNAESFLDFDLTVAAFVSLSYLNLDPTVEHVVPRCFALDSPMHLRLAAFKTCALLASQSDADRYISLYDAVAPHIRDTLEEFRSRSPGFADRVLRGSPSVDSRPESSASSQLLTYVFEFLAVRPEILVEHNPSDDAQPILSFNRGLQGLVVFLAEDDERVRSLAGKTAQNIMTKMAVMPMPSLKKDRLQEHQFQFWRSTSLVLSALSNKLLDHRLPQAAMRTLILTIRDYLKARLALLKNQNSLQVSMDIGADMPERSSASADIEVAFLLLLCSTDLSICAAVTSSLAVFCEEGSLTEIASDLSQSSLTMMRNFEPYLELSSQNFHITGLVAFQKRFRKLLAMMTRPTTGILSAWEMIFFRWAELNSQILATPSRPQMDIEERAIMEWRNYSGFLASLGGSCIADTPQAARMEDSMLAGLRWIDRVSPEGDEQSLLERFLTQCLELLFCSHLRVREATKEVLGTELNSRLLPFLLRSLEAQLKQMFEDPSDLVSVESRLVVLEQAASLLRTTVERLDDSNGTASSVDFGTLSLNIARALDLLRVDSATLRVKIRVCQLCEVVTSRRGTMKLGHGIRVRNQVLGILFEWMAPLGAQDANHVASTVGVRMEEVLRQQRDLDRSCLRAFVNLTYRLPLQAPDAQTDAENSESKAHLFQAYFRRLVSMLELETRRTGRRPAGSTVRPVAVDDSSEVTELAITAISNLLSANVDVGLKDSLEMGYHESTVVRTAFLRVLCNILSQGTEFERLSESAVSAKHDMLLDLIVNDLQLTVAICDACPIGDVDELTLSLLTIFESRGRGLDLLKALIEHEVAHTEMESELLRRNCVATKMLSAFARWKGFDYLRSTLGQVLERLIQSSDQLDFELDPTRTASPEELENHASELCYVTKILITDICSSADKVPPTFRKICFTIATAVTPRFPEAKFTAVGAFVFLRFFCPAIVAPDSEGLVNSVPTKEMRRGLLLIAKVVQNLANNVLFGAKEPYMYSLNDFLVENIYKVTTFLREISAPAEDAEPDELPEPFDFAACTSLHRFLFDHWEIVRQKAVAKDRRSWKGPTSVAELDYAPSHRSSSIDKLGALIPTLGPPNIDISWNRPRIAANTPPMYSRFQEFMLRTAGRNTESGVLSAAVYDGGHTKDDMPVICVILRNLEVEGVDEDMLLFSFLKIVSRMWHRPFCALFDATCYTGVKDLQEKLIQRLETLSPFEFSKHLCRLYIYNMNSAYRKAFRRVLRLIARNGSSAFHPQNLEYHLVGNFPELQAHFHMSSLQLPKDTISVVTDSRSVFPHVIRLSKTKGKLEVVIKIGGQFVQITTSRKQEIIPGFRLSATVNDVFRVEDVDETKPSFRTEDNGAFGLKTDNGRVVMYFTTPRKAEILQALKAAKNKHVREVRPVRSFERLMKPEDVPGSLLNICLMNLGSDDMALRLASYNLLCGLSKAFHFNLDRRFVGARELSVPANSVALVTGISERLARSEAHLTPDFLSEFFLMWDKLPAGERPLNVLYMAPWLPNLRMHILLQDNDSEKGRERVSGIGRKLIDIVMHDSTFEVCFQEHIWPVIAKDEILVEIILDEMIKVALENGPESDETAVVGTIAASIGTAMISGKIIARLRKVLNRSSLRPTRYLVDNAVWDEICVLLRICLVTSFDSRAQSQLFLPELFHVITMITHSGSLASSRLVHSLLVNSVHSICVSFPLRDGCLAKLKATLSTLSEAKVELLFNVHRHGAKPEGSSIIHEHKALDAAALFSLESIAYLMLDIINVAAPSTGMANVWRSRWMSLVASTAFQSNPAIQPRAFAVMGCLAREDVDDDLLYQVLVSLRTGIHRFTKEDDSELLVAIVSTLTKMMTNLPASSRYVLQLFWLAISLVRLAPPTMFECTALFVEAVLQVVATSGALKGGKMARVLLQGRIPVEEASSEIDELYGVRFTPDTFHFASSACLVKGLTEPTTQVAALRVLSSFLEVASASALENRRFPKNTEVLPYLGLVAARAASVDESREILWLTGVTPLIGLSSPADVFAMVELDRIEESDLLLNAALSIADFRSCEDFVQQRTLVFLARIADQRPSVLLHLAEPVASLLDEVLRSCQTPVTLEAAHALMRALAAEQQRALAVRRGGAESGATQDLDDVLEENGLGGIWRISSFRTTRDQQKRCAALIDKLIELIII
ncbi:MAG: hypothetical protein M1825_000067 [Sarcosagium campestre]|nr:MAG: hypothetical protein M1825_000067 [Sarcosagium campestre]